MNRKYGKMLIAYRYRLLPTKAQHGRLRAALEHSRQLYNGDAHGLR